MRVPVATALLMMVSASVAAQAEPTAQATCNQKAADAGLRGRDANAAAAICVAEARLECTKKVVVADPAPRRWNALVRKCLGMEEDQ